ncbi:MAG: phospholipase D-like domain-containing protein, partial [Phycisphaerales bacterium]|nr:phospholipase D-like domain-containing protein [Phycisphaerales bacterium]
ILRGRGHTNLRNHRKIAIADARRVFAGGTNIASEYLGPTPKADRWKDLSFVLEGPAVTHYCEIFCSDWAYAADENLDQSYVVPPEGIVKAGNDHVQVVPSGPDLQHDVLYDAIIQAIFNAKRRVRCVTPYFIPDDTLMRALELAARRGVEVDIITPLKSNHGVANVARGPYLRDLEKAGANILLYEPGMVHAKITLVDDNMAMIGSTNLDQRSLFLNYEISAIAWNGDVIARTSEWVDALAGKSLRGTPPVGRFREIFEGLVQVAAPLL